MIPFIALKIPFLSGRTLRSLPFATYSEEYYLKYETAFCHKKREPVLRLPTMRFICMHLLHLQVQPYNGLLQKYEGSDACRHKGLMLRIQIQEQYHKQFTEHTDKKDQISVA